MKCRKCKKIFSDGSEEHIILQGLGGKTKTTHVFCEECNKSFSQIDRTLVEQFAFAKNLLEIQGKRGSSPRITMTDPSGNPVVLKPGGKPVYLKPQVEETAHDEGKIIKIAIPPHIWEQYKIKIEERYGIGVDDTHVERVSARQHLTGTFCFGGVDPLRAVAKMAYSLVCDHFARHNLVADFTEIENFIFSGTNVSEMCLLDDRPEIYEEVPDFSNVIVVHFNAECNNIIASVTIFGSFGFSILIARNYSGPSCTVRMMNNPINQQVRDDFETKPLERRIDTSWLLSRPNYKDSNRWISMGKSFSEKYMSKVVGLHYEMVFEEIKENCMKQAGFYNSDKDIITDEMIDKLSECVAKKIITLFKQG